MLFSSVITFYQASIILYQISICDDCNILSTEEVEEQVELLEKLFPDWFCRRSTHNRDIVYR